MDSQRRREEIEKKKAKIADLKRTREDRTRTLNEMQSTDSLVSQTLQHAINAYSPVKSHAQRRKELEDLVASLVGERARKDQARNDPPPTFAPVAAEVVAIPFSQPSVPGAIAADKAQPKLAMSSMVLFEAAPMEKVFYEKEQQTVDSSFQTDDVEDLPEVEKTPEEFAALEAILVSRAVEPILPEPTVPRVMDEAEREIILESWQFQEFFEKSTKLVERALNSKADNLVDYTLGDDDSSKNADAGNGVNSLYSFFDDRWTKNRSVTEVAWSPRHPELLLAAYNKNHMSVNDPDGIVLVWNMHAPNRPEFIFHAQSDVTAACFSDFHPNYIVGGTYSGQVLIWDNRAKSSAVLKTPLSAAGHTHPVFSLSVVGTQNAHNLVTCSTDGTMCSWTLDMLASPQEILELAHNPIDSSNLRPTNEIAVTTFGFPANETATFWVGTEEGCVYQANRYDQAGGKAGINGTESYVGHDGMITSIHFHPQNGPHDFSDLFITASVDWTVKLWKARNPSKAVATALPPTTTAATQKIKPIYSFEQGDDYVFDAKWSPVHPSVFACVDGNGELNVYDLNGEVEVPSASITLADGKSALNKLAWDKTGSKVSVGAADGRVHVCDVGQFGQPKPDEWSRFQKTIGDMNALH